MLDRASKKGLAQLQAVNLRDFAFDKHRVVDDSPYGGGQGMVLKPDPFFAAVDALRSPESRVILMSPSGTPFSQAHAARLCQEPHLILLSGHYEGVDQRVADHLVDEELSIGDYILTNGTLAAAVVADAVVRLIPGVLGNAASPQEDSFSDGLLEHPQYTRPEVFQGWPVPEILLSGNHGAIEAWRLQQRLERTRQRRPDLFPDAPTS